MVPNAITLKFQSTLIKLSNLSGNKFFFKKKSVGVVRGTLKYFYIPMSGFSLQGKTEEP